MWHYVRAFCYVLLPSNFPTKKENYFVTIITTLCLVFGVSFKLNTRIWPWKCPWAVNWEILKLGDGLLDEISQVCVMSGQKGNHTAYDNLASYLLSRPCQHSDPNCRYHLFHYSGQDNSYPYPSIYAVETQPCLSKRESTLLLKKGNYFVWYYVRTFCYVLLLVPFPLQWTIHLCSGDSVMSLKKGKYFVTQKGQLLCVSLC